MKAGRRVRAAVVFRAGRALDARILDAGRVGGRVRISDGPVATVGFDVVAAGASGGATVAWRDGRDGPVMVADLASTGASAPQGTGRRIAGVPRLAVRGADTPITWEEGQGATTVLVATPAAGSAVAFQTGCATRFGLGPDWGVALSRRASDGSWTTQALSRGSANGVALGASDGGELVAAWNEGPRGLQTAVLGPGGGGATRAAARS